VTGSCLTTLYSQLQNMWSLTQTIVVLFENAYSCCFQNLLEKSKPADSAGIVWLGLEPDYSRVW